MTIHQKAFRYAILLLLFFCMAVFAATKTMSVEIKKAQVRSQPAFMSKVVANLFYGDQVEVEEEKDAWAKVMVTKTGQTGWMHNSALTSKKIVLKPSQKDMQIAASSDELALAGKGFNKQVENEFRKKNPTPNFDVVDQMEQTKITQKQMQAFITQGDLAPEGGAQ